LGYRHGDFEGDALVGGGFYCDGAAVAGDDGAAEHEAQAGALLGAGFGGFGAVKTFKDALLVFG